MKIIIVFEGVLPTTESPVNLGTKFMRMSKPEELDNSNTVAVEFANYMQMAAPHYFNSRSEIKAINPPVPVEKAFYHYRIYHGKFNSSSSTSPF